MKKVIHVLLLVMLLASSASAVTLNDPEGLTGDNLSVLIDENIDGAVIGGTTIGEYDSNDVEVSTPWTFTALLATSITVEISPSGSGLVYDPAYGGINKTLIAKVYGTVANIKAASPKEYTIKVTAKDSSGATEQKTYKFKIYPDPAITATTPPTITWSKDYSFTPTATSVTGWEISSEGLDSSYITDLPEGLEFDEATGTISGVWKAGDDEGGLAFGTDKKELTRKIRLHAIQGETEKYAEMDYTLKFAAVAPVITDDVNALTKDYFSKMIYDEDFEAVITAVGPGAITWTVDKLPSGLEIESDDDDGMSYLNIEGTPTILMKAQALTITARNAVGTATISPKATIGLGDGQVEFEDDAVDTFGKEAEAAIFAVGKDINDGPIEDYDFPDYESRAPRVPKYKYGSDDPYGIIEAHPGPLVWTAKGLPDGITLSYDKNGDGSLVELTGIFKKAGTFKYTITAKNSVNGKSISLNNSFIVYEKPAITTTSLPALSTGKTYTAKLAASNNPVKWEIGFASGTSVDQNTNMDDTYDVDGESESYLEWSYKKLAIVTNGKGLTARPRSGKFSVRVIADNPAGSDVKIFTVDVNGTAPAITTKSLGDAMDSASDGSAEIETTGTTPITIGAYIEAATAKTVFGVDKAIDLTESGNVTGLTFTCNSEDGTGTLEYNSNAAVAYKGLPIVFSAENSATSTTKPVTKKLALTINGDAPEIYILSDDEETKMASSYNVAAGASSLTYKFRMRGSGPLTVTSSLPFGKDKGTGGIYNVISEDKEEGYKEVTLYIDPLTVAKETKTAITLTAANNSTKAKATTKLTVIRQLAPTITTAGKGLTKEVEVGKAISLKLAAKGSSPITWTATDTSGNDAEELLASYDLTFDTKTGTFASKTKKTSTPTYDDNGDYSPAKFLVTASNAAGTTDAVTVSLGIMGKKPKLTTKTITLSSTSPDFTASTSKLLTNIAATDTTANVKYSTTDANLAKIGLTISASDNNEGILGATGTLQANKGTSVKITASNYGGSVTGSVKFVVNDPDPEIEEITIEPIKAQEKEKAASRVTLTPKLRTGDTVLKWAVTTKPAKGINAAIKADDKLGNSATLTLTLPKGFATTQDTSVGITVTNSATKKTGKISLPFRVLAYNEPDEPDDPDDPDDPEDTELYAEDPQEDPDDEEDTPEELSGTLTLGTARTVAGLSESQIAFINENGYTIAAVLPELSADISGQYDIDVELEEYAPVDAKLYWFAFPRNAEPSEDDEIADFYDEDGGDIETVPENRKIIVAPWLRENVIYAPVIMVK